MNSGRLDLIYNDLYIPTYLHYNATNPDLTLASADIAHDAVREVIYDPGLSHRIIISELNITINKTQGKILTDGLLERPIGRILL